MSNLAKGASPDVICSASTIPRLTLRELFCAGQMLRVPVFQRRYCWGDAQLSKLCMDLIQLASRPAPRQPQAARSTALPLSPYDTHSLGRLVLADHPDTAGDLMVIDGQQRITTACVFLSALRDLLPAESPVRSDIENLLFPNGGDCCVLTPTYFDRPSFEKCVGMKRTKVGSPREGASGNQPCDHVAACRRFFETAIPGLLKRVRDKIGLRLASNDENKNRIQHAFEICAQSLVNALMNSCTVLCFKMREQGEEVMAAYSRLAMRDAMLSFSLNNRAPGVKMELLDLARNLVCCQFPGGGEKSRVEGYMRFWRPIEQWASDRALGENTMVSVLDKLLKAFISSEGHPQDEKELESKTPRGRSWMDPGQYSFPMYTQLQRCVERASKTPGGVEEMLTRLRAKAESIGDNEFAALTGADADSSGKPGGCVAQGRLCVDCILKKNRAKRAVRVDRG